MKLNKDTKIWRGIDLAFQSWHKEFDKFWPEHLKVSKILTLIDFFRANYILFQLKKYRGVAFHETEGGYKIWRGIDLLLQNWHKEFDKFWPAHSKVSKTFTIMGSFWAKYIFFELNSTEELSFMKLKRDKKFGEESTCCFKIDTRNLTNFENKVSKIFASMGSFLEEYILFELKKYREVWNWIHEFCITLQFHETEEWCKIWRKTDLLLEKWREEFGKFWPEH